MITINCVTGNKIPLSSLELYPERLKKHGFMEVERIKDSILKDGFCFPISVGKVNGHNYIIDGECTYLALKEIGEEFEVPVTYIRCNEDNIKKLIVITASTNHLVTKSRLEQFTEGTDIDLKSFGFNEGALLNFCTVLDIDRYFDSIPVKNKKQTQEAYATKLRGMII